MAKRKPAKSPRRGKAAPRLTQAEIATWYAGKSFSFDWTSWHFPNWIKLLEPYRGRRLRVLEIGSWEGRSALFFLNHLSRARLTCIDSFEGGKEHRATPDSAAFLKRVEKWFDANTAEFKKRVEKIKAHSAPALAELGIRRRQFDVAYIDGSHIAADVYSDAVLTWPLMVRGGLVIFDDYQWKEDPEPLHNPKPGIDAFLKSVEGQYRVVHRSYQIAIVKQRRFTLSPGSIHSYNPQLPIQRFLTMALPGFSLAKRLAAGETVFTGWCALPAPIVAESIAREGFSAVTIDQQHGLWDTAATATGILAIRAGGAAPIVRVPLGAFAAVSRALDFGAEGIVAPMINTAADARAFVSAAKFPPLGERSWGPQRAMTLAGVADPKAYLRDANANIVTIAMIETRTAMDNLDIIAGTPGIDVLFVGPSDLSITLSDGKELDPHSAIVEAALDKIIAAANKAGKVAGLYCANAERAVACAKRGIRFLAVGSDLAFLRAGAGAQLKTLKG